MTYKNIMFLLTLAAVTIQSVASDATTEESKTFLTKVIDYKTQSVASISKFISDYKKIIGAVTAIVTVIPAFLHITDGKKFNNIDEELEEIKTILNELKKSPKNSSHYKKLARQLYLRAINFIRKVTGHRSYKITMKNETIALENKDGSKNTTTIKDEKTISATKACKIVEDSFEHVQKVANLATLYVTLKAFGELNFEELAKKGNLTAK